MLKVLALMLLTVNGEAGMEHVDRLQQTILQINSRLDEDTARQYAYDIRRTAVAFELDPLILASVIATESSFKESATGTAGEVGLMQIHPRFHATFVRPMAKRKKYLRRYDINITYGAKFLRAIRDLRGEKYKNFKWVEFYNRGPNAKTPKAFPYRRKVLKFYKMFGGTTNERARTL